MPDILILGRWDPSITESYPNHQKAACFEAVHSYRRLMTHRKRRWQATNSTSVVTRWVPSIDPAICSVSLVNFHSFCTALYYWGLVSPNQPFRGTPRQRINGLTPNYNRIYSVSWYWSNWRLVGIPSLTLAPQDRNASGC